MMLFWLSEVNFPRTGGGFPACGTLGLERVNEVQRDWRNWFVISRVCHIEVLWQTFYCNFSWAVKGRCYIEVHQIKVLLYMIFRVLHFRYSIGYSLK